MPNAPASRHDDLAAELSALARPHIGSCSACLDAVIDWHMRALEDARRSLWVPGMAGKQDPMVEEALDRFHAFRNRIAINRLIEENTHLRRQLASAITCISFYAGGSYDGGSCAKAALRAMLPLI